MQLVGVEVRDELLDPGLHERLPEDLLDVGPFLGVGGEHVVHQRAEVLGVLVRYARELALDNLARQAVQAVICIVKTSYTECKILGPFLLPFWFGL